MVRRWISRTRQKRNDSGQTLVESAICFTVFFVLIFGIMDFGFLFYAKVTLQNAVRTAARYAITGNCSDPMGNCFTGGSMNRYNTIVQTVQTYSFAVPPTAIRVTCISGSCPSYSNCGQNCTGNAGGPSDTIMIAADYTFNPIFIGSIMQGKWVSGNGSNGSYMFTVSATFKNEPFPPPSS